MNKGDWVKRNKGGKIGYIMGLSGTGKMAYVQWIDNTRENISIEGLRAHNVGEFLYQIKDYEGETICITDEVEQAEELLEAWDNDVVRWQCGQVFLEGRRTIYGDQLFNSYKHIL